MIQAYFNKQVFDKLPTIKKLTEESLSFESNQMQSKTLQEANNSRKSIDNMTEKELDKFQNNLINIFKYNGWI